MNAKQYANEQHAGSPKEGVCNTDVNSNVYSSHLTKACWFFFFFSKGASIRVFCLFVFWNNSDSILNSKFMIFGKKSTVHEVIFSMENSCW